MFYTCSLRFDPMKVYVNADINVFHPIVKFSGCEKFITE